MQAVTGVAEPGGEVRMTVGQFGKLADLPRLEAQLRLDPGAPGDPRYWVPLAHFLQLKIRYDALHRLAACDALGFANLQDDRRQCISGIGDMPQAA